MKWWVLSFGLLAVLATATFIAVATRAPSTALTSQSTSEFRSIDELNEGVFEVDPDHWHSFVGRGRPPETGWIAVPLNPDPLLMALTSTDVERSHAEIVGPQVCGECHADTLATFRETAHFRTSQLPSEQSMAGQFAEGNNHLATIDPRLSFQMDREGNDWWQRVLLRVNDRTYRHGARIDLVMGSGNHGQTYLYRLGDGLYQLPISYLTETRQWVNSPGFYRDGTADFSRPMTSRCLECHATYVESVPGTTNRYFEEQLTLGVTCVRCHGPGQEHVAWHRAHPDDQVAHAIVQPAELSPQRANDICAQCHSGIGRSLQPPFSFRAGEPLEEYLQLEQRGEHLEGGLHTDDQLARLKMSRCFQQSEAMTCTTCHDPHQAERNQPLVFAERCLKCHTEQQCQKSVEVGDGLRQWCVDCHMPKRRDLELTFDTQQGAVDLLLLRDHYIHGWPAATETVLQQITAERSKPDGAASPAQ